MAITNAQQFKQLVNPPMKGKKRPGYRGPGGYQGGRKIQLQELQRQALLKDLVAQIIEENNTL